MEFVESVNDCGAPEIFVSHVAKIVRISTSVIRVTLISRTSDREGVAAKVHLLWDVQRWLEATMLSKDAAAMIVKAPPETQMQGKRRDVH